MKWSKECLKLAEMCWAGDEIRSTNVMIDQTYHDLDGNKYKITESTYEELVKYQEVVDRKFTVTRNGKTLTLIGIK